MWKKTSPSLKNVNFPIGADPNGSVGRKYGVWDPKSGHERRGHFIINPDGVIQVVEFMVDPLGRNFDELIRKIQGLKAIKENPGKACPADWMPGKPMINIGKEYIGEY